jgi:hypothetical protein
MHILFFDNHPSYSADLTEPYFPRTSGSKTHYKPPPPPDLAAYNQISGRSTGGDALIRSFSNKIIRIYLHNETHLKGGRERERERERERLTRSLKPFDVSEQTLVHFPAPMGAVQHHQENYHHAQECPDLADSYFQTIRVNNKIRV